MAFVLLILVLHNFFKLLMIALESGNSVDVVYLDLRKAFDCVPHRRLLSKLRSYGVAGNLFDWVENFLTNRKQRVCIRGSFFE